MPRISIGRFLLAESVLRNVTHSGGKYAPAMPVVTMVLKFGAGGESRRVVAVRRRETNSGSAHGNARAARVSWHSIDGSGPYAQSGDSQMRGRRWPGDRLRGATNDCRACQKGPKREPKRQARDCFGKVGLVASLYIKRPRSSEVAQFEFLGELSEGSRRTRRLKAVALAVKQKDFNR